MLERSKRYWRPRDLNDRADLLVQLMQFQRARRQRL